MKSEAMPQRLDHYCWQLHPEKSINAWRSIIAQGLVRLNGQLASKGQPVHPHDVVSIDENYLQENLEADFSRPRFVLDQLARESLVYQDDYIIIINKPAAIPSHPLSQDDPLTAADLFASFDPNFWSIGRIKREGGLLQRLDNDSSGLLVAARSAQAFEKFEPIFRRYETGLQGLEDQNMQPITKTYLALVHGVMDKDIECKLLIGHDARNVSKMTVSNLDGSQVQGWPKARGKYRQAHSSFRPIAQGQISLATGDQQVAVHKLSLVQVELVHGQRHQVRVHAAAIGHALVGDNLYAGKSDYSALNEYVSDRHLLHAFKLRLWHPFLNKYVLIEAKPHGLFVNLCNEASIDCSIFL